MGEYFKPRRRKFGVITLLMACVLMVGWVRSNFFKDELWFSKDPSPNQVFVQSCTGGVRFFYGSANGEITRGGYWWISRRCGAGDLNFAGFGVPFVFDRRWQYWGFDFGKGHEIQQPPTEYILQFMFIPYWSIVLPLTLLSAFLLLSKPRKSTPKKITEPSPAEGK